MEFLRSEFSVEDHDTDIRTEIIAGITTFLAMSYIIVVNPAILTATAEKPGIAVPGYAAGEVQQMLAVVTILSAVAGTALMALYANRPFALAPGLGINAFFAFTVVGTMGIPWETALAAVVVEGVLFTVLTLLGIQEYVMKLFPEPVKLSVGAGIGLFLILIGLQAMNVIVDDPATLISLGNVASNPVAIVSIAGLLLTMALYTRNVPGAIALGIVLTTILAWGVTLAGVVRPGALVPESLPAAQYDIRPLAGAFLSGIQHVEAFSFSLIVFTFFCIDFFDTAGTLTGVSQVAGFLDDDGNVPEAEKPLLADAVGTVVGGILGTSTVTTFVESVVGVEEGGRTGLTAAVVTTLFIASLLLVPIAAAIPVYASHIALVVVGLVMMQNVVEVVWDDLSHAFPAGITIVAMPLTYSIAWGIAAGIITYPIVKVAQGRMNDIHPVQWLLALVFILYFAVRTGGFINW